MGALAQREVIELRIEAEMGEVQKGLGRINMFVRVLDLIDGDPDLEAEDDFGADDVGENRTWPEHVDQHHNGRHATAEATLDDDVEDDDPREDDDQDTAVDDAPCDEPYQDLEPENGV